MNHLPFDINEVKWQDFGEALSPVSGNLTKNAACSTGKFNPALALRHILTRQNKLRTSKLAI